MTTYGSMNFNCTSNEQYGVIRVNMTQKDNLR